MMTKLIRAGFAIAALLIVPIAAQAADLRQPSYKAPAYTAPSYANWAGFYVGVNAGYGFGSSKWTSGAVTTGSFDVNGGMGGGTLGYNYQTGIWVWGLEGDFDASWLKGSTTTLCPSTCETKNDWLATARGRLGYAGWSNWLPYITGGAAFGDIKMTDGAGSGSKTDIGYVLGLGVEYAFLGAWSTKIEYLYADLGKATCAAGTCGPVAIDASLKASMVRVGLNYRF